MITSRRVFLAGSASLFVTSTLNKPAVAASGRKTNLIVVMLRGGMDGLAAVPFTGDDTLTKVRPDINVRQPMKLNGDFACILNCKNLRHSGTWKGVCLSRNLYSLHRQISL